MARSRVVARLQLLILFASLALLVLPLEALGRGPGGHHGGGGPSFSRGGPASGGSFRGGHSNRTDRRQDRGGDRHDRRDDRHDDHHDRRDERHEWHEDRWKRRVGAHLTVAAFRALSCSMSTTVVNGVTYYGCGGTWYNRRYVSGQVTYVIVEAPPSS